MLLLFICVLKAYQIRHIGIGINIGGEIILDSNVFLKEINLAIAESITAGNNFYK